MKASKIYRKAAEMMVSDMDFSCLAVKYAAIGIGEPALIYVEAYEEMFFPPERLNKYGVGKGRFCRYEKVDAWGDAWSKDETERGNCRILALLFMSEIAKGE